VSKRVDFPRGHAENSMSDDEVVAKFNRMASGVVSEQTTKQILNRAWSLDELSDVTPVFAFPVE